MLIYGLTFRRYYIIVKMAYRPNDTYNSIREQLERQTQGFAQERSALNVQRPSNNSVPQGRTSYPLQSQKKNELKNKIKEIIDLCKDENENITRDIAGVAETEKGIYGLLQQADIDNVAAPGQPSGTFTPIRGQPEDSGKNFHKDIQTLISNSRVNLSQDALQLINEIQRRSLAEIEKLRNQKLNLINQLNDEIRRHNAEKKRSLELERELDFYRKGQGAPGDGRYENELKARVAYLENQLKETQNKEGFKGDLQDFQALFAQGEAIRQETLRLLRMKEAKGYSDDVQKKRLKEQVYHLQQKVQQLESQRGRGGKTSYQVINQEYSPISQSHKVKDSYRNSANEYESLVMEMRKITSG